MGDNICKRIARECSEDIGYRPFYKFVKIFPRTQEEEAKILAIIAEEKTGHFRHARRPNRFFKTVVKGLPRDTMPHHISDALTAEGYMISKVAQLTQARTKAPLPTFQVLVIRTGNFKSIIEIDSLLGKKVSFEPFRKISRIPQMLRMPTFWPCEHPLPHGSQMPILWPWP